MTSPRQRRIFKEVEDVQKDTASGIKVWFLSPSDITHLRGSFQGPPGSPYETGTFEVDITIPNEYPFRPPKMKFETRVYHPNISSQTGAICLDTLAAKWSPVLTLKSALLSLQSLLADPEPNDPQDAEVANVLKRTPELFKSTAREWTAKYAGGKSGDKEMTEEERARREEERRYGGYAKAVIGHFERMGFAVEDIVRALSASGVNREAGEISDQAANTVVERLLG